MKLNTEGMPESPRACCCLELCCHLADRVYSGCTLETVKYHDLTVPNKLLLLITPNS